MRILQTQIRIDKNTTKLLRDWAIDRREDVPGFRLNHWLVDIVTDGMRKEGIL